MPGVRWCLALTLELSLIAACFAQCQRGKSPTNCRCGWTNEEYNPTRIINGAEVTPNKYPWMVQMKIKKRAFNCGGSIITKRHVLTAAHCTWKHPANSLYIITGAHYLNPGQNVFAERYDVESKVEHENYYSRGAYWYDISLLITVKPIEFNEVVGPICLPSKPLDMTNQKVRIAGWGLTNWGEPASSKLQEVVLDVVDIEICKEFFRSITPTPTQLCLRTPQKGACNGDSGGPGMLLDPQTGLYIQVGVTSFGGKKCSTDHPLVQTDVSHFIPWIQKNIASFGGHLTTCSKITCL